MSGAQGAATSLRSAVEGPLKGVASSVSIARDAQGRFRDADDLLLTMQAAVGVVLACELLADDAAAAAKAARVALAAVMAETGATSIETDGHKVSLRDAPRMPQITDAAAIPDDYMRQPPPKPDMALIAKAMRDGFPVPGVVMGNGGAQSIQIRNKS